MARFIYFGIALHGHVNPGLGLIKALVERGETVFYYSSEEFRSKIESTGAIFKSYRDLVDIDVYQGNGIDALLVFADFILEKSRLIIDRFLAEIKALAPDCIIHDAFCHWGRELARILNIPGVSVFANFAFIDAMAERDPQFFMENILRAAAHPLYRKYKNQADIGRKILDKLAGVLSAKYGLTDLNVLNDIFGSKEKLNILFTSRQFQLYSEVFDDSYLFIGPSIVREVAAVPFPYEKLDGRPLIYLALGTIFNERTALYQNCLAAFRNTDRQVVMAIGNKVEPESLGEIPTNFIIGSFVPQLEILKRAAVFITHGGANSINESICFQVPMVVVPQAFDQFLGAIMVEKAGAGINLGNSEAGIAELTVAVGKILADQTYREKTARIKKSFTAAGGLAEATAVIFDYLGQKRRNE